MSTPAQKQASRNYRQRLSQKGMVRFDVLGLDSDRALIRSLAKRLAQNDSEAARLRAEVRRGVADKAPRRGGILAALRQSPLVGAEIDIAREATTGRDLDL